MESHEGEPVVVWTAEEETVIARARAYFDAIARCEAAGGRTGLALATAMPEEAKAAMPMMGALGL